MNPYSSNMCIRYSVWVIEGKYTHNLPIYLLYNIYNKIGANWCINPNRRIRNVIQRFILLWSTVKPLYCNTCKCKVNKSGSNRRPEWRMGHTQNNFYQPPTLLKSCVKISWKSDTSVWNGIRTRDIIHFSMYHHYINCYFPCLSIHWTLESEREERDGTSQTHWRHGLQLSDQTKHRARPAMCRLIRCHCLCPHPPTRSSSLWAHKNNIVSIVSPDVMSYQLISWRQ